MNVLRKKLSFPGLKRAVIEDKASGTQLIQDLIEAGLGAGFQNCA